MKKNQIILYNNEQSPQWAGGGGGAGKTAFKLYATQAVLSFLQQCKQEACILLLCRLALQCPGEYPTSPTPSPRPNPVDERLLYFPHSRDFSFCSLNTQFYFGNRQLLNIF